MSQMRASNMQLEKETLSVFIVNFNSTDFIECSLENLALLTKHSYKAIILDNGSRKNDYKKLLEIAKKYKNVSVSRNNTNLTGSMAHGTALNQLVENVDTPYFCILDADATWLAKNWDDILINEINEKVKVIGTQTSPETYKPSDFPLIFAILFETDTFKKLNIDFRPSVNDPTKDTGYEIREKYLKAGYEGKILEIRNTRSYKSGPFSDIVCAEYYLKGNNHIFASHFGRGSNPRGKKNIKTNNFLMNIFLTPVNYLLWMNDKKKWINRCLSLAQKQAKTSPFDKHVNVLTVHYNTQSFIENIADLLGQDTTLFFNLIVVDNSNNLDTQKIKISNNTNITVVQSKKTLKNVLESHRYALNLGLKEINPEFPFTLFLDPDIIFSKESVSRCRSYMINNDLDIIGVHKFYQYKYGKETFYPYIWFTLIKTNHLLDFQFKSVHPLPFRLLGNWFRQDTGDSIYSLIRRKKLSFYTIPKFPKTEQLISYPLKDIKTDDWFDRDINVTISHYRGGSAERKIIIHPESAGSDTERFIKISKTLTFNENFSLMRINFGGGNKKVKNTVTVDIFSNDEKRIIHDLNTFPYPFPDNSVSYCILDNVLEHLDEPIKVLKELNRITAPKGIIEIYVPYFRHGGAYQDPTHKHFFHENYFDYFTENHLLNYEVGGSKFRIIKKELIIRKTGIFSNPILLIRKALPFKRVLKYFLWDIYDTVHVILEPIK